MANEKGFTSIEMLTVLVVVAILAAVAMPDLLAWSEKTSLNGAAQNIYANFQKARQEAIKRNTSCTIVFGSSTYTIFIDDDNDFLQDAGETVILDKPWSDYRDSLSFNITCAKNTDNDRALRFTATGFPKDPTESGNYTLAVSKGDSTANVRVNASGNITMD